MVRRAILWRVICVENTPPLGIVGLMALSPHVERKGAGGYMDAGGLKCPADLLDFFTAG